VVWCCCAVNTPACRSKTAYPSSTPAGTTTGVGEGEAARDGDGDGDGESAAEDGATEGWDQEVTGGRAGPHPTSSTASTASSSGRGTVIARSIAGLTTGPPETLTPCR